MKLKRYSPRRNGQAIVEFALVLPVLLLVVIGLIEAGRLLFIYGSNVTASRQAVRYGSATGLNNSSSRKYLDCAGITAEAKRMGFLADITNVQINYYKNGNNTDTPDYSCDGTHPTVGDLTNGARIEVTTTTNYSPILSFIPFSDFPIISSSRRTIFIGITIEATSSTTGGITNGFDFTKSADTTTFSVAGETINYSFLIDNTGSVNITNYSIEDPKITTINCPGTTIAAGSSVTCTGSYTTSADDVTAGNILNTAKATATFDGGSSGVQQSSVNITYDPQAIITLEKSADVTVSTVVGNTIHYTYRITNAGSAELTTFNITDITDGGQVVPVSCPAAVLQNVGDFVDCTGSYTLKQADIDAGAVTNVATAQASNSDGTKVSDIVSDEFTVITRAITLSYLNVLYPGGTPQQAGDTVEYRFQLTNNTSEAMLNPALTLSISRKDGTSVPTQPGTISCLDTTLNANAQTTCVGYYTLLQDDLDSGGLLLKNAIATAKDQANQTQTSNTVLLSEANTSIVPDMALSVEVSLTNGGANILNEANPPTLDPNTDTTLYYTYTIENIGNVTLGDTPNAIDYWIYDQAGTVADYVCTDTLTDIAPSQTIQCTFAHTITQEDWDRGSIIHTEVAYTEYIDWQGSTVSTTSAPVKHTIYTYDGDRLNLVITSSSGDTPISINDNIFITYIIQNTGNTTLSPLTASTDYPLTSNLTNHIFTACPTITANAAPGEIIKTCLVPYQVAFADITGGDTLNNEATAQAENPSGTVITANTTLTLEVVPIKLCKADQWTSSEQYQNPDLVVYCEGDVCAEWKAQQSYLAEGNTPGYSPPGAPAFWEKQNNCYSNRACDVSLTNINMANNTSTHSLTIQNNSGVSVEIGSITLSWDKFNLTGVALDGSSIYSSSTSQNALFPISGGPWTIGALNTIPANTSLDLTFSKKTRNARAVITFSDNLCEGISLDSNNP